MGAITSAIIGAGTAVYASRQARRQARRQQQQATEQVQQQERLGQQAIQASDPFAAHRASAAERLNALIADPSNVTTTAAHRARLQGVQRQLAAQGFTGSGNALVEAAEAAGTSFQQEFDNLARLAGVDAPPGAGFGIAMQGIDAANARALASRGTGDATRLTGSVGVGENLSNLALTIGNRFNRPAIPVAPVQPLRRVNIPIPRLRG
ncbi:MAG: hypothetical protein DDT31_00512 [Syntrophomonadaceae bacterium]|nr:hypothetical protein [Bacillota bacterium]